MSDPLLLAPSTSSTTPAEVTGALAAAAGDPLWLIGRQWQTAELHAEDGGAAVTVEVSMDTAPLLQLQAPAGTTTALAADPAPLQSAVDADPAPPLDRRGLDELVAAGIELLRLVGESAAAPARPALLEPHYRLAWSQEELAALEPVHRAGLLPWQGRVPDPRRVVDDISAALGPRGDGPGPLPTLPGVTEAVRIQLEPVLRGWLAWLDPPGSSVPSGDHWLPDRLEYSFAVTAAMHDSTIRLHAPEHLGGELDWHSLLRSQQTAPDLPGDPQVLRVLPSALAYPGMPLPRYWEFENGSVNLDLVQPHSGGPAALVLLAFVHQHANDWFVVPAELGNGTVTAVRSLVVTNTFGETFSVPPTAELDGLASPWQIFALTPDPQLDGPTGTVPLPPASPLVLLPSAGRHLHGPVVEELVLLRDEMANLAWAVERLSPDRSGRPVDRFARYQRRRPPPPGPGLQGLRYRLGSDVPDFWYPLEAGADTEGHPVLRLTALPDAALAVDDDGVAGTIIDHPDAALRDEEVPREGALIRRQWHVARWTDGSTHSWLSRSKQTGLGEGASGLRFDYLDDSSGP